MKINGIEVQGIRKVHIEDIVGRAEKVWYREPAAGGGFYWQQVIPHIEEPFAGHTIVKDEKILDLIRWVFVREAWYDARVKGDTVYVKVTTKNGTVWKWGSPNET